jgi:hypothetical protein
MERVASRASLSTAARSAGDVSSTSLANASTF